MTHGDTIIHGNSVEFFGDSTGLFNFTANQLTKVFQVHMPRHKLGKGIGDGNDGLLEIIIFHASGAPKGAGTCHVAAGGGSFRAVNRHKDPNAVNAIENHETQNYIREGTFSHRKARRYSPIGQLLRGLGINKIKAQRCVT